MTAGCPQLKAIDDKKELEQDAAENSWGIDANSYDTCRLRYYALRNFYKKRDADLRKTK